MRFWIRHWRPVADAEPEIMTASEYITDAGVCMPAAAAAAAAQKLQLERWMRGTTRSISCSICIATCIR